MDTEHKIDTLSQFYQEWFSLFDAFISSKEHTDMVETLETTKLKARMPFVRVNFFTDILYDINDIFEDADSEKLESITAVKLERVAQVAGFYPLTNEKFDKDMWIPLRKDIVDIIVALTAHKEPTDYKPLVTKLQTGFKRLKLMERALLKANMNVKEQAQGVGKPPDKKETHDTKKVSLDDFITRAAPTSKTPEKELTMGLDENKEFIKDINVTLKFVTKSRESRMILSKKNRSTVKDIITIAIKLTNHFVNLWQHEDKLLESISYFNEELNTIIKNTVDDYDYNTAVYQLLNFLEIYQNILTEKPEYPFSTVQRETALDMLDNFAGIMKTKMTIELQK